MGRIIGLDYGSKTVGVAVTDPTKTIVSPFETIKRDMESKLRPTLRRITEIAKEKEAELIVLGHPLNMDDSRGERALKTEAFGEQLEKRLNSEGISVKVVLWDERLSSMGADEILEESGIEITNRKQYIDKIAAALILEDYMKNGR